MVARDGIEPPTPVFSGLVSLTSPVTSTTLRGPDAEPEIKRQQAIAAAFTDASPILQSIRPGVSLPICRYLMRGLFAR